MKYYIICFFLAASIVSIHSQNITISGVVSDKDGSEMPGVNVIVTDDSKYLNNTLDKSLKNT